MLNKIDEQALTMIEAEKRLDGIVVNDPIKVISEFKNNQLFRPAPDENDYNIVGSVPKVNSELA